jgi:outer membrane lipoprotein-sorting protein
MNLLQVALVLALLAPQEGDSARIQALIDRVRSDRIEERQAAAEDLRKIGKEALPALEAAIKGTTDPEVALRLKGIVNALAVPGAAESLKSIERLLAGAGAVRIAFHQETRTLGKDLDVRQGSTGTLLFAKGNKARLELAPEKGKELLTISDGESLANRNGPLFQSPNGLTARLAKSVARVGICFYAPLSPWGMVNFTDEAMPDPALEISDLALDGVGAETATLTYTLPTQPRHPGLKVRLAFDPKTIKPQKRTMTLVHPRATITLVEVYDEIVIDPVLPGAFFKF